VKLAGRNAEQYFLNAFYTEKCTQMCKNVIFGRVRNTFKWTGVSRWSGMSITCEEPAVYGTESGCGPRIMATTQVGIFRKNRKMLKKWVLLGYSVLDFTEGAWYLVQSNLIVVAEVYTTLSPEGNFSAPTHLLKTLGMTKISRPLVII